METLDATLSRVLYHEPSKFSPSGIKFLIAKTTSGQILKGEMRKVREGERYRFWGTWAAQKGRPEPAFEFLSHEILLDEGVAGVTQYLRNYVPGLGLVRAAAVVEALGADTLKILRTDPEKALAVPGITPAIVEGIRKHFEDEVTLDPAAYARLVDLFAGHRFPRATVKALLRDWGSDAPDKVVENPYMLLAYPRMGWKSVDAFALAVGYARDGLARQVAAIAEGLERLAEDGHTFGTRAEIEASAFELIGRRPEEVAWNTAVIDGMVARLNDEDEAPAGPDGLPAWLADDRPDDADEAFALPRLAGAERAIARHLARLAAGGRPLGFSLASPTLNEEQRAAVKVIEDNPVSILVGAPGTGKSYTLASVMARLRARRGDRFDVGTIRVVAPTGKAARRAAELLDAACPGHGIECSTIHRALGVAKSDAPEGASTAEAKVGRGRDEFGFRHGEGEPLEADFLVADECSMIDANLMTSLLGALATGTRVVLVGDPNQLPSVGPGSVLRDLIAAGVPTATLATIQRSDGGGRVVRACHAIKDGKVPQPAARVELPTENWVHIEEDDPAAIAEIIVELHESARGKGTYDPLWDMQVVSAQKDKHAFACNALNARLGRLLNPAAWAGEAAGQGGEDEAPGPPFRVGDKVIRRKNGSVDEMQGIALRPDDLGDGYDEPHQDWRWRGTPYSLVETTVVNGDMGQVLDIVVDAAAGEAFAVVRFRNPERLCRLPMGEHHLGPAYALTCHSVQGSGFPYVIVPVHHAFYWDARTGTGLFSRELVYTAISRAEKLLVTVGPFSAVRAAVGRPTIHARRTRLEGLARMVLGHGDRDDGGIAWRAVERHAARLGVSAEAAATGRGGGR